MAGTGTGKVVPTPSPIVAATLIANTTVPYPYSSVNLLSTPLQCWIPASGRALVTLSANIAFTAVGSMELYVGANAASPLGVLGDNRSTGVYALEVTRAMIMDASSGVVPNSMNSFNVTAIMYAGAASALEVGGTLIVQPL